tara:strand:- start:72 stop:227 length:156 start_codon:yes stop_codon:yes gene_type:complete
MKQQETIFTIKGYDQLTGSIYIVSHYPFKTREEAQQHCKRMEWVEEGKSGG